MFSSAAVFNLSSGAKVPFFFYQCTSFFTSAKFRNSNLIFWLFFFPNFTAFPLQQSENVYENRWMEKPLDTWLPACRWLWNRRMMASEKNFMCFIYLCIQVGLGSVHNACLWECTLIYEAEMASARCLEMAPLTFRPADWKIQTPSLTPHTHTHTCTDVETHTVSPPMPPPFPSSLSSVEFKSKMNLSVTGRLQLQEKHTFQHSGSGRESGEERCRSCWDSWRRRRTGSKGGAVFQDSEKLVWFKVQAW